jgi:tRNA(Ile)-lysidine synthase
LLTRRTVVPQAAADAAFAPLAEAKALLLAVSGGPDSTALLLMAQAWAARRGGVPRLEAATVDHGLRPESADEARAVAALCEKLAIPHHTLLWQGEKPKTRLQERAREARYALLAQCAKAAGADVIVTGHHLDDQAETALFRLMRGSGVAGLRGMSAQSARDGVTIARPLLGFPRRNSSPIASKRAFLSRATHPTRTHVTPARGYARSPGRSPPKASTRRRSPASLAAPRRSRRRSSARPRRPKHACG